jgi:hypothetical protein
MHAAEFFASLLFLPQVTIDLVAIFVRGIQDAFTPTCRALGRIDCMFFHQEFRYVCIFLNYLISIRSPVII